MHQLLLEFDERIEFILNEEFTQDYKAAVGIVQCGEKFLLGLAQKTGDDRSGLWVFPGGHIKRGESVKKAAEREVWEEMGIKCKTVGDPFIIPGAKGVAFVHCKARTGQDLDHNQEFSASGWFKIREMKALKLYKNVRKLLDRIKH